MPAPPVLSSDVELVDPTTLEPHPDNVRQGDLGAVVELVRENGFVGVVYAQRSTRRIIAGHTRTKAAVELAIPEVPVLWLDVDDAKARRLVLADNRASDLADYDDGALADLLRSIHDDEGAAGLVGTGFDGDDLDDLVATLDAPFEPREVESYGPRDDDDDPGLIPLGELGSGAEQTGAKLTWPDHTAPMDAEERAGLDLAADAFYRDRGSLFGFVRHLLNALDRATDAD